MFQAVFFFLPLCSGFTHPAHFRSNWAACDPAKMNLTSLLYLVSLLIQYQHILFFLKQAFIERLCYLPVFTCLQSVSLLQSTPCALTHRPLSTLSFHRCRVSCMSSCPSSTTAARTWSVRCCPWSSGWSSSRRASTPCPLTCLQPSAPSMLPWFTCSGRGMQGMVEEEEEVLWFHCPLLLL